MKPLYPPQQLRFLLALHARKELSSDHLHHLQAMKKGADGEIRWTTLLSELPDDIPILYDLNFEINQSIIQLDALCILQNKIVIFEIKNYSGNYTLVGDQWLSPSKKEMKSPLIQIKRNEPLIHQFLKRYQLPIPFEYHLIFVNPKFILYGAKPNENIIFPGQIPQYLDSLKKQTVSPTLLHTKIIETLLDNHKNKLNMLVKPEYHYEELAKGVFCSKCCGRMERLSKKRFKCKKCSHSGFVNDIIFNNIKDYSILFPERKIKTLDIYEWIGKQVSTAIIHRILQKNAKRLGNGRATYYELINSNF
ncbi:nuclease-related domain-containing protein [Cytobacillus kochii]|uniref:nuclease-related domain-containing protein n=1 Tax=Cytobacillus kochii TaxID=859143 RepID=UPI0025A060CB|nr:nuclease-related domain-containing protein [Cytobacillus kochii]MDM5209443.1 nuclease-related domain-containing protein [Cytobacillus kochii]